MQTSIEWLIEQLRMQTPLYTKDEIIEIAKEMHKQEIINAAIWMPEHFGTEFLSELGKQYYKQTFTNE